jgi:hypothetical protein
MDSLIMAKTRQPQTLHEVTICRSLFWISYNFSLSERRKKSAGWKALWFGALQPSKLQKELAAVR